MDIFEPFQKRFQQSAHKQEYRGGGCGDRGGAHSTPYLVPAPPTSPSFAPNPNSQKRKRRRGRNPERGSGGGLACA
jgi:hypothetical protein